MSNLIAKHPSAFSPKGITSLSVVAFLMSLSSVMVGTVWALYLYDYLQNDSYVGFLTGVFAVLSFLSYFFFL